MDAGTPGNDAHQALPRQARLRAEYAKEYPEIEPAAWMSAKDLAGKLVERTHARRRSVCIITNRAGRRERCPHTHLRSGSRDQFVAKRTAPRAPAPVPQACLRLRPRART
jgi:hypothetical protein